MNMGAGILLRTVSRAAGSTIPAGSNAFCSSCTGQLTRPSSLRASSSCGSCHTNSSEPLSQQAAASPTPVEFDDDWEFADDPFVDNRPNFPVSHAENRALVSSSSSSSLSALGEDPRGPDNHLWHVFSMPPSFEEANVATMELQAALLPSHDSSVDGIQNYLEGEMKSPSSSSLSLTPFTNGAPIHEDSEGEDDPRWGGSAWAEPHLYTSNRGMVQLTRNPVHDALELLQSDPHVKGAVISIVSDPDVWSAMMKNEKIQELRRIFERSQGQGEESPCSSLHKEEHEEQPSETSENHDWTYGADTSENHDWIHGVSHVMHSIIGVSKQLLCQVHEDLSKFIMSIFAAFSGSACPPKKDDPFDKTMRSSMMLAVLVVTVVVLKRLHI